MARSETFRLDAIKIADRYAAALVELAQAQGQLSSVEGGLAALDGALEESPSTIDYLASLSVATTNKIDFVDRLSKSARIGDLLARFLNVLVENGRAGLIREVAYCYKKRILAMKNEVSLVVKSAQPLDELVVKRLAETLSHRENAVLKVSTVVDPELLAGVVVEINNEIFDASARAQLNKIGRSIRETV